MRKLIAGFAISLDGYIEGPNEELDWMVMDKEMDFEGQMKRFDTFLMGRKSYEKLVMMGATSFPGIQCIVFSNSLSNTMDGFTLVKGEVVSTIKRLKKQTGKDIALYGGAELLTSLLKYGLVDELVFPVMPLLLGQGKHFLGYLDKRVKLALIETRTFASGTVRLSYRVK